VCQFAARGDMDWFVVVGTARDLILNPRSCSGGSLIVYRLAPDGSMFELVHMVSHNHSTGANTPSSMHMSCITYCGQ